MRIEYKYFIPWDVRAHLISDLELFVRGDANMQEEKQFYNIASVYFDNYFYKCYDDKEAGLPHRNKIRIRFYPNSHGKFFAKLEFKCRRYDKGFKLRHNLDWKLTNMLLENASLSDLESAAAGNKDGLIESIGYIKSENLFPVMRIDYDRAAFVGRIDKDIRITIDQNIKCCTFTDIKHSPNLPIPTHGNLLSVLEIKSENSIPFWLRAILEKYSCKREAISKYGMGIERISQFNQLVHKAKQTQWI